MSPQPSPTHRSPANRKSSRFSQPEGVYLIQLIAKRIMFNLSPVLQTRWCAPEWRELYLRLPLAVILLSTDLDISPDSTALDISADLQEVARSPVAVVSSGVKSILDIGRYVPHHPHFFSILLSLTEIILLER